MSFDSLILIAPAKPQRCMKNEKPRKLLIYSAALKPTSAIKIFSFNSLGWLEKISVAHTDARLTKRYKSACVRASWRKKNWEKTCQPWSLWCDYDIFSILQCARVCSALAAELLKLSKNISFAIEILEALDRVARFLLIFLNIASLYSALVSAHKHSRESAS